MTGAIPFFLSRHCHPCQNVRRRTFSATCRSWSPARNSNYYDLLGVRHDATLKEIKQAFFSKSKKLHPDSNPANPNLHNQFVKLNEAYKVLSNESSRRHYDSLRVVQKASPPPPPYPPPRSSSSTSSGRPFGFSDFQARSSAEPNENTEYWQQFYGAPPEWQFGPKAQKRRQENRKIFGYCLLLMFGSMVVHYLGFRKLEEIHRNFMDEKDRTLTKIYNESKEQSRSRWLQKQEELLRQKQAELVQQYHTQAGQHPEGGMDSQNAPPSPPPPPSTAK